MNKQQLLARRDYFNLVHGVTLKAIATFADRDLEFRPAGAMRNPRELIFHIYTQEQVLAEAAAAGSFTIEAANKSNPENDAVRPAVDALATVPAARTYADACHQAAENIFRGMTEDEVARPVESFMGPFPAWQYFLFAYDEHWHHRGQLYTYLRLLGKEPPGLYDF
jgi:uncharacterized damage-inducible protein DinB